MSTMFLVLLTALAIAATVGLERWSDEYDLAEHDYGLTGASMADANKDERVAWARMKFWWHWAAAVGLVGASALLVGHAHLIAIGVFTLTCAGIVITVMVKSRIREMRWQLRVFMMIAALTAIVCVPVIIYALLDAAS
jgi:hypothetical protein